MKTRLYATTFAILIFSLSAERTFSQSTFSHVHQLLQNSCAASGCHNSADRIAGLDLSASLTDVYSALVGSEPENAHASANGDKLIAPGSVTKSFLYRKIADGFDPLTTLHAAESDVLPGTHALLDDEELELVRQWIQFGAPVNDTVVDMQLIADFYNKASFPLIEKPLSPEEQGLEGRQYRIGPILLRPGQEVEYFHKFFAGLDREQEVHQIEVSFDNFSHHFVLFEFDPSKARNYPEGLQNAGNVQAQVTIHLGASEIGAWNVPRDEILPPGTAFFWDESTHIALDYHVRNYSQTMILGAIAYVNVYTREKQQGTRRMRLEFPVFGGFKPFILKIPPTGQPYRQEFAFTEPGEIWDVWKMQGHTHKLGTDFDMYLRNPDGTRGEQIYEGHYNADYTFNQGFFDDAHAPVRRAENPFIQIDMNHGIILEAEWINPGPDTIRFGFTTEDEMFAAYLTYTLKESSTAIETAVQNEQLISVFPNPVKDVLHVKLLNLTENNLIVKLYDSRGMLVAEEVFTPDNIALDVSRLPAGTYFLEARGDKIYRKKVAVH